MCSTLTSFDHRRKQCCLELGFSSQCIPSPLVESGSCVGCWDWRPLRIEPRVSATASVSSGMACVFCSQIAEASAPMAAERQQLAEAHEALEEEVADLRCSSSFRQIWHRVIACNH